MLQNKQSLFPYEKMMQPMADTRTFSSISSNGSTHNLNLNGLDFSFHHGINSSRITAHQQKQLYKDIHKLSKQQLIDLLIQIQISDNKHPPKKIAKNPPTNYPDDQQNWLQKYKQLSKYMKQYVKNTNQANTRFMDIIQNLKQEKHMLNQKYSNRRCERCEELRAEIVECRVTWEQKIVQLEQSLEYYVKINNKINTRYQKLKILYDKLNQQLKNSQIITNSSQNNRQITSENSFQLNKTIKINQYPLKSVTSQSQQQKNNNNKQNNQNIENNNDHKQLTSRIKLLQIQNNQLKEYNSKIQSQLEGKSQKIKKLLGEIQKISEEKWRYKGYYLEKNVLEEI